MRLAPLSIALPDRSLRRSLVPVLVMSLLATAQPAIAQQAGAGTEIKRMTTLEPPSAFRASLNHATSELSQPTAVPNEAAPRKNWVERHPVWTGTLIGVAGGTIVDIAACNMNCGFYNIGAALGAFVGILASAKPRPSFSAAGSLGPADTKEIDRVVRALGVDEKIEAVDAQGRKVRGTIVAFDAERVTVDQKGTDVIVAYEDLRSIRKQPLGAGAKIGLAVGALTAASVVIGTVTAYSSQ
jgi:hypothetical protein